MKRLENVRVWVGGGVVAAFLLAVAGWFLLVGPQLAHAADLRDQQEQARQDNAVLQSKVVTLKKQSQQLPTLVTELRQAQAQLPPTPDLSGLATQVNAHAEAAEVTISSLTISGAEAVTPATDAAPAVTESPAAGSEGTGSGSTDSSTTAGGTAAAGGAAGSSTGAVYAVTVSVTTGGTLAHQRAFLDQLSDTGPRAVLVGSTQLGAGTAGGAGTTGGEGALDAGSTMTSALTFFVAPQSAAAVSSLQKQLAAAQAG